MAQSRILEKLIPANAVLAHYSTMLRVVIAEL